MKSSCEAVRELLPSFVEGELSEPDRDRLREHLAGCEECSELADILGTITGVGDGLDALQPPDELATEVAASPCGRWLGLLFGAVDRQITDGNLERLPSHLESCPGARQTWTDLTLIHRPTKERFIYGRRAATAAAYILAVLVSLTIGHPVSIARSPVVQDLAGSVTSEVQQMATDSRGELRVMVWRIWKWGSRQVDTVRKLVEPTGDDRGPDSEQGES